MQIQRFITFSFILLFHFLTVNLLNGQNGDLPDTHAEANDLGLLLGVGYGIGYSHHADQYETMDLADIKEFSGFRLINFDARLGWIFSQKWRAYLSWKLSPGITTISPYRSDYKGVCFAYFPEKSNKFSLHTGVGHYNSKVSKLEGTGEGFLADFGLAYQFSEQAHFELTVLTGKLDPGNIEPNPFPNQEFNLCFEVAYYF